LIQRVSSAQVSVDGQAVSAIGRGLLVLLGIHKNDTEADGDWIARKLVALRIFEDEAEKMNRSVQDIGGALLIVSQFTLYGSLLKGTRPGFSDSMPGEQARVFYNAWLAKLRQSCNLEIKEGVFAAKMAVQLVNDGPVTLMLDSRSGED
jgi:D-tyrosyl-tRNA(Tyr) deacylase